MKSTKVLSSEVDHKSLVRKKSQTKETNNLAKRITAKYNNAMETKKKNFKRKRNWKNKLQHTYKQNMKIYRWLLMFGGFRTGATLKKI